MTAPEDGEVFGEGEGVALVWSNVAAGAEYITEIEGGPGGSGSAGPVTGTSIEIGAPAAGFTYTWRVKTRGPSGESGWSEPRSFTVRLAAPTQVHAQATSCTQVDLSWRDNSGNEDGYRIYRDGAPIADVGADTTTFAAKNLNGGAGYAFAVRAFRGNRESASVGPAQATTPACDVTEPTGHWSEPTAGSTLRSTNVRLEGQASDTGSGIEQVVFLAQWGGDWNEIATVNSPPYRIDWDLCAAGVPDGQVSLRMRIHDGAGNTSADTIAVNKRVNCAPNDPPSEPHIETPGNGEVIRGTTQLAVTANDSYDTSAELRVAVQVDDGPWQDANFDVGSGRYLTNWDAAGIGDGSHTVRARATDSGGLDRTSERIDIVVDAHDEPPRARAGDDVSLTDTNGDGVEPTALDGTASTHDPQRTASYSWEDRWNGASPTPLGSGAHLDVEFGIGVHVVTLTVTDSLGNHDEDELVITVDLPPDTTAPVADWTEPMPDSTVTGRSVVLGASASDTGGSGLKQVRFRAQWGGEWRDLATIDGAESPYAYAWDLCAAGVPDGDVELDLQALDNAGNAYSSPSSRHITKQFSCVPAVGQPPPAPAPPPASAPAPAPVTAATTPRLELSPRSAGRGQSVTVTASGFQPGEELTVMWDRVQTRNKKGKGKRKKGRKRPLIVNVASATVSPSGHAVVIFHVPKDAVFGGHPIEGLGSFGTHASATFEVDSGRARAAAADVTPVDNSADSAGTAGGTDTNLPTAAPIAALPDSSANDPSSARKGSKRNGGGKHDRAGPDKKHGKHKKGANKKSAKKKDNKKKARRNKGDNGGKQRG